MYLYYIYNYLYINHFLLFEIIFLLIEECEGPARVAMKDM